MTIRFTSAVDGYAKGAIVSTLSVAAEAAYVAANQAEYEAAQNPGNVAAVTRMLGSQGIPCIIAPNGTIATNGVYTSGTALPLTYARAWVRFPADAVVGGAAGWYYVVFSSTTVGQVYTAFQGPAMDKPYIPATLTAAVGSNAAFTQTTGADIVMGSAIIPAGMLGQMGAVDCTALTAHPNNANNKISKLRFGGSAVLTNTNTTTLGQTFRKRVQNRNTALQVIHAAAEGAAVATSPSQLTVDTAADVQVDVTGQLATATDYLILESFSVEVLPAP